MNRRAFTLILRKALPLGGKKAFTLIEVLVVVAIIGVLMTIGVLTYASIAKHSRDSTRKADLSRLQNALQQHYLDLRSYPAFDTTGANPIYSAAWQLSGTTSCSHVTTDFLVSKYLAKVPEDPSQQTDLTKQACSDLTTNQTSRYLYITNSSAAGPTPSPTMFGLMATLESPVSSDILLATNNPLIAGNNANFGPWFSGFNNYDASNIGVTANYLLTGTAGR